MRSPVLLLAVLLAGCSGAGEKQSPPAEQNSLFEAPAPSDTLTPLLPANSTEFQGFLVIEDEVRLGNESMAFTTGRGMGCQGDADNVSAGSQGWVVCMVRLTSRPEAMAQAVHDLGIGYDQSRLTARQASAPVEWRFLVALADGTSAFDSGWRAVDLSPGISDPVVQLDVRDPCEASSTGVPVGVPNVGPPPPPAVDAILSVALDATHGQPFVRVDLASSRPGDGESKPYAAHGTGDHMFEARWETVGDWRNFTLDLNIDLGASAAPTGPMEGPCQATVGKETQEWTVDVGVLGADGAVEFKTRKLQVDVYLSAA